MSQLTITTEIKKNERISISALAEYEPVPPFCCMGINDTYPTAIPGYPKLFEVLRDLPQHGYWLFWTLAINRSLNNNIALYTPKNKTEETRVTRGYKVLKALKLVVRLKRGKYLINPKVLFPQKGNYQKVLDPWMTLTKKSASTEEYYKETDEIF